MQIIPLNVYSSCIRPIFVSVSKRFFSGHLQRASWLGWCHTLCFQYLPFVALNIAKSVYANGQGKVSVLNDWMECRVFVVDLNKNQMCFPPSNYFYLCLLFQAKDAAAAREARRVAEALKNKEVSRRTMSALLLTIYRLSPLK